MMSEANQIVNAIRLGTQAIVIIDDFEDQDVTSAYLEFGSTRIQFDKYVSSKDESSLTLIVSLAGNAEILQADNFDIVINSNTDNYKFEKTKLLNIINAHGDLQHIVIDSLHKLGTSENRDLFLLLSTLDSKYHDSIYAIDQAEFYNGVLIVNGWLENAAYENLHFVSSDLTFHGTKAGLNSVARADVSNLLVERGRSVLSDKHGFCGAYQVGSSELKSCSIYIERGEKLLHIGDFATTPLKNQVESISYFWRLHSGNAIPPIDFIRSIARPLLQLPLPEPKYKVFDLGPQVSQCRASVIVPLFKEWFFLRSILAMQENFGEDIEWIIVCDDPDIAADIGNFLMKRSTSIKRKNRLVINDRNYGYSQSNNIGVSISSSQVCVFMNSDIWVEDSSSIELGINAINEEDYAVVGFRLLFEDNSLQHDGMTFDRKPDLSHLYIAEHAKKGLPPSEFNNSIDDVLAVTGALMIIRKDKFLASGGFDKNFIRGDFEDADLCLRFYFKGERIGLIRNSSIYHLERQSIRKMSDVDFRSCVTLVNCVYFNDKWAELLDNYYSGK